MIKIKEMMLRYVILLLLAFSNLYLFYLVFTPLTLYPVFFLINLFFDAFLYSNIITFNGISIEIIGACVAGSAYYLLLILNLSTPEIKPSKRIKMIALSFLIFLLLNILRIFFLSFLVLNNNFYFDLIHQFFWYFLSTIFVVLIWFGEVKLFKIKNIPIYTDIKFLLNKISNKK